MPCGIGHAVWAAAWAIALLGPAVAGEAETCAGVLAPVAGEARCLKAGDLFRDFKGAPEMVVVPPAAATARPFAAARTQVTFADWDACVSAGGCAPGRQVDHGFGGERKPAVDISEEDVADYLGWLSERSGAEYRLLADAEWQYAARAGQAARLGLDHLKGTAWEWVSACPGASVEEYCLRRVRTGGAPDDQYRFDFASARAHAFAGFRVARSLAP